MLLFLKKDCVFIKKPWYVRFTMYLPHYFVFFINILFQGFGFITFATHEEGERAKKGLHGTIVEGRKIEVCFNTAPHFPPIFPTRV